MRNHTTYCIFNAEDAATSTSSAAYQFHEFDSKKNILKTLSLDSVGLIMSYNIHKLNWLLEASGDIDINTTEQSLVHI